AARKSLRPTACRTCGTNTETPKQNQTQIPCACRTPLEKTLEADISILLKNGHFYFALTRICHQCCARAFQASNGTCQSRFPVATKRWGTSIKIVDGVSVEIFRGAPTMSG